VPAVPAARTLATVVGGLLGGVDVKLLAPGATGVRSDIDLPTDAAEPPSSAAATVPTGPGRLVPPGGRPVTRDDLFTGIGRLATAIGLDPTDVVCAEPFTSGVGLMVALAAWQVGADLVLPAPDGVDPTPLDWPRACAGSRATVTAAGETQLLSAAHVLHPLHENIDLGRVRVLLTDNAGKPIQADTLRMFNDVTMEFGFDEMALCPVYAVDGILPFAVVAPHVLWRCRMVDPAALDAAHWRETLSDGGTEVVSCGRVLPGSRVRVAGQAPVGRLEVSLDDNGDAWRPTGDVGAVARDEVHILGYDGWDGS
jgi:hypothetical protein